MFRSFRHSRLGFTLVELMITLVVLLVLTLLAVPSFRDYMEKQRVRGAADQITDLLARARAAAVKNNLPVAISAASDADGWCVAARMAPAPTTDLAAPRADTTTACDCENPATAPVCTVESETMVLSSASLSAGSPPTVTLPATGIPFSYTPKLGGISTNGANSSFLAAAATRQVNIASPNGRYSVSVFVTPLGQSYTCVPSGKPVFLGYRSC